MAASAWLPELADTAAGRLCFRAATAQCGAALAVAVATIWEMFRVMDSVLSDSLSQGGISVDGDDGRRTL